MERVETDQDPRRAGYGLRSSGPLTVALVAATAAAGVAMVAVCAGSEPVWFASLWLATIAGGSWVLLWRAAHRLALADGVLEWWAPLRSGRVPVDELVALRPSRLGGGFAVLDRRDGGRLLVVAHRGLGDFAGRLAVANPAIEVRHGLQARASERFNLRSWYRPAEQAGSGQVVPAVASDHERLR